MFFYNQCVSTTHNFDFPETEQPLGLFGLKSFDGFAMLGTRMEPCVLFGHKNGKMFIKKTYRTWQTVVKTFKKHQNIPTETYFLDET